MSSGISDGSGLDQNLTREQLATMLYRYAQYKGYDVSAGEDTNILSYADVPSVSGVRHGGHAVGLRRRDHRRQGWRCWIPPETLRVQKWPRCLCGFASLSCEAALLREEQSPLLPLR